MSGRARRATRPNSVSFRRFAGARADCGRSARVCGHRARGGLALRLAGAGLGKYPEVGRVCQRVSSTLGQGIARYDGKAAPTRATLHQARSGKRAFSAAEKSLDRGRSSETISCSFPFSRFLVSTTFKFGIFQISIVQRSRKRQLRRSRLGAMFQCGRVAHDHATKARA